MDTTTTIYKLPIHKHPLLPSVPFIKTECSGCHVVGIMHGSYTCNDPRCFVWFHKKCAEAPLEINHPSHTQHPLLLTNHSGDGPCDLCGQKLLPPCYSCSKCEFKVDLACGMKPSLPSIEHPACHEHPLVFLKKKREEEAPCEVCKDSIGGPSYSCLECRVYFHVDCVRFSTEVNHPCHSNHPLKFTAFESLSDDGEKICLLCGEQPKNVLYHCSICNFSTCLFCTMNPPPLVIEHIKTHKHPLTLFSRRISYTCDACGMEGTGRAYICLQCDFVVHGRCIGLPRVININRHDHRISFSHHLGAGYSKCGVCHQSLSKYYGAYSCSVCPNYAVHSTCAYRYDVWDGVELEGIPDDTEYIAPFIVVGDDLISHFSHRKHTLRLQKENIVHDKWLRCEACMYHVGFDPIYSCEECGFVLHEKCANLPMKKRLVFDTVPYTLEVVTGCFDCMLCETLSGGFRYTSPKMQTHVHCGSLSEPLIHDGHLHPLYFYASEDNSYCDGCYNAAKLYLLRCDACDFDLCFYCASLPGKIWHRKDEHPLTLYCGEKLSGKNWCDICEREIDPKWFYTCYDCGVTLHARCVLGDFSRLMLEWSIYFEGKSFEIVPNNHNTRPLCSQCHLRCNVSIILKDEDNGYICSRPCLYSCLGMKL